MKKFMILSNISHKSMKIKKVEIQKGLQALGFAGHLVSQILNFKFILFMNLVITTHFTVGYSITRKPIYVLENWPQDTALHVSHMSKIHLQGFCIAHDMFSKKII